MEKTPAITEETTPQIWDRGWIEYGQLIARKFSSQTISIETLSRCPAILEQMNECYKVMVKWKMTEPLENQDEGIKKELKDIALTYKATLTTTDMVLLCKTLLCIEILLKD